MNIEGMDYNTQRSKLRMPEYGRSIHQMIEHCIALENREERQLCAESIVKAMDNAHPELRQQTDYRQKLWNHLAVMSNFRLDVDYPCEVTTQEEIQERPERLSYGNHNIPVRHYGDLVFQILDELQVMEPGDKRDELVRIVACQMKRDLIQYGNANPDAERICSDLAYYTRGIIQADPASLMLDSVVVARKGNEGGKKKKK